MENPRRRNSSSGDKFSFPVTIADPDQLELGPGSPNSPADHLFFNGKLQPHAFPIRNPNAALSYSRSVSSRSSLMSSRSNSTNSRGSNCGSARTSTSEASDHRRISPTKQRKKPVSNRHYQYGSCQRWQLFAAAPVLKHQGSRSSKVELILETKESRNFSVVDEDGSGGGKSSWFGRKIFKSFVSACKECHAINTRRFEAV